MQQLPWIQTSVRRIVALWVAVLLMTPDLWAQCAMCKETVDGDKATGGGLANGIHYSILFMLALPVTVLGGFGFVIWRSYRKAARDAI